MNKRDRLTAALAYAARGWRVLPLTGKIPRTEHGLKDASADPEQIAGWWRRWPEADVGVRTGAESGLLVLDVDGQDGADTLHELERERGELPATVETLTGGGGRHVFFRHPGEPVANTEGKLGPGLDSRGDNGYVVVPPSRHESGRRYEWSVDGHPDEVELAPPPSWLLDAVRRRNGRAATVGDRIPKGKRFVHSRSCDRDGEELCVSHDCARRIWFSCTGGIDAKQDATHLLW